MDHWGITVEELHDLVPAAEEIDLADEVEAERWAARFEAIVRRSLLLSTPEGDPEEQRDPAPTAPQAQRTEDGEADLPTDGQALGLLEHVLGAERIDPE